MAKVKARRIIHSIHAVSDIDLCRRKYQDVFGAIVFNEGYEPSTDRNHALLYAADHMIEPMAPRDATTTDKGFARWLDKHKEGWHSFEIKVDDAVAATASLKAGGCELIETPYPVFFFVRPTSTGGILLEVCEKPMVNDPAERPNWNPGWAAGMPSGLVRLEHIACVVRDVDAALHFFTQLIDGELLSDEQISTPQPARRALVRIGGTDVAIIAPADPDTGPLGAFLSRPTGGVYALVWAVEDEDQAKKFFEQKGLNTTVGDCVGGSFAIAPADFQGARHEFRRHSGPAMQD
jgi:catechol 2,3-dioxygenase-like lactoylglutathione lyase family enzyme